MGLKRILMDYIKRVGEAMTSYNGVLGSNWSRLSPQEIRRLNDVYLIFCVIALSLDPLFGYILVFNVQKKCLRLDTTLGTPVVVLRFLVDFFYIIHMVFQFRAAIVSLSSQASGRVKEMRAIARIYLFFYFLADVFVILPLPQVRNFVSLQEIFNLFLYTLASHVVGVFWYLFYIERNVSCWREACQIMPVYIVLCFVMTPSELDHFQTTLALQRYRAPHLLIYEYTLTPLNLVLRTTQQISYKRFLTAFGGDGKI